MLRKENAQAIGEWLLRSFVYRWGVLCEIVSDNGVPFVKAIEYLAHWYHIHHIHISGYNSRTNGLVKRPHFDIRQVLFKACNGIQSKWASVAYSIFWADRITTRFQMGCSPYFAVTGTHPLLLFDISKATYLLPPLIPYSPQKTSYPVALSHCKSVENIYRNYTLKSMRCN